ncbi:SLC13 family permease [Elusimicrobiota bacterium]
MQTYKNMQLDTLPSPAEQGASKKLFSEGHWHGLELIPLNSELRQEYGIPSGTTGLLVDEITLEAAECGFLAGDMVQSVGGYPIDTLKDFLTATVKLQNNTRVDISVWRSNHVLALSGDIGIADMNKRAKAIAAPAKGKVFVLTLKVADYYTRLGYANVDAAPPIQPGAISPHKKRGRSCAACHIFMNIGGQLAVDAGDITPNPPPISLGMKAPHGNRGSCNTCHQIVPGKPRSSPSWPAAKPQTGRQGTLRDLAPPANMPDNVISASPVAAKVPAQVLFETPLETGVMWMGMKMVSVDPAIAEKAGLPEIRGVYVESVALDSQAQKAGLKTDDIITMVGSIYVSDVRHLRQIVSPLAPGDEIEFMLLRHGKEQKVTFLLGSSTQAKASFGKVHFAFPMLVVAGIFAAVYLLVFVDIFGHLFAFILGAVLSIYAGIHFGFYSLDQMHHAINYHILIFIIGMNIISAVLLEAGFMDYMSKKITIATQGNAWKILMLFSLLTYIVSCFMDNIATILILVPITLTLAKDLDFDPKPVLICQVISSNLGGASTMVGDFPNMLIGLSTDLQFHDFVFYEMPCCIILLTALLIYVYMSKSGRALRKYKHSAKFEALFKRVQGELSTAIKDREATKRALIVLGLVILGFLLSGTTGVNPAIVAFGGGIILLFICGLDKMKILRIVGVKDVLFFACLFVMVGAAEASGILLLFANFIMNVSGGNILAIALMMMWFAGIMCAFMNAGPTAAVFIPVIMHLGIEAPNDLFWWALSLGVLAGSSAFLTAASGGPLTSSIVHKFWKKHKRTIDEDSAVYRIRQSISFREYARMGMPIMLMFLCISTLYITFLYYL